jgi:hypothetical protein
VDAVLQLFLCNDQEGGPIFRLLINSLVVPHGTMQPSLYKVSAANFCMRVNWASLAAGRLRVPKFMISFRATEPLECCLLRHRSPPLREYCLLNDVNRPQQAWRFA